MNVLMVGVDESTRGGMWTVVDNYLRDPDFSKMVCYVPTYAAGDPVRKILFMLRGFHRIRQEFRRRKIDVVHVHMSERGSVYRKGAVMRYARKRGAKVLLHMHGAELEVWYRSLSPRRQRGVRRIVDRADRVVILGDYWKDFMEELVSDPGKIRVVYNAVPIPDRPLYSEDSRNLLFLGAVIRRKGIYDLLDAMKQISSRLPEQWKLEIYGPDENGDIEEQIAGRKLSDRVRYCGWLPAEEREAVLARTAVNVLPSYHEGLPMTILEAMAGGIPSVTTPVAAIPEAVDGDNGILIPPGDVSALGESILRLCLDAEDRNRRSAASRETAIRRFSLQSHLEAIRSIYEEMTRT